MNTTSLVFLHLWILASQAFYMYLSNKSQLKTYRYLYLIAIPIAAAFPVIIYSQDQQAYSLYEYAIVFCIIFAAVIDSSLVFATDREYMTDATCRSLIYTYFMICTAVAFAGNITPIVRAVTTFLLAGSFIAFCPVRKHSAIELVKGVPIAALSILCAWAFLKYGL